MDRNSEHRRPAVTRTEAELANGWTPERRALQAELIKNWRPWEHSTGPRTVAGKARVAQNAYKGGEQELYDNFTACYGEWYSAAAHVAREDVARKIELPKELHPAMKPGRENCGSAWLRRCEVAQLERALSQPNVRQHLMHVVAHDGSESGQRDVQNSITQFCFEAGRIVGDVFRRVWIVAPRPHDLRSGHDRH